MVGASLALATMPIENANTGLRPYSWNRFYSHTQWDGYYDSQGTLRYRLNTYITRNETINSAVYSKYRYREWGRTTPWPKRPAPTNYYFDWRWKREPKLANVESTTVTQATVGPETQFMRDAVVLRGEPPHESVIDNNAVMANLLNQAKIKALNRLADAKVNLGVMWAERSKTSRHILSTATRVYRAFQSFRRGNLRGVAHHLGLTPGTSHKTWLEYRYAWTPLLMDIHGSVEFLADSFEGLRRPSLFVKESAQYEEPYQLFAAEDGAANPMGGRTSRHDSGKTTHKVTFWIRANMENESFRAYQQSGLANPLLTLWEITPWSFVWDWFIQVGDFLNALSALSGLTVIDCGYSESSVCNGKSEYTLTSYGSTRNRYLGSVNWETRRYLRSPTSATLHDLRPTTSVDLSIKRLFDIAALGKALRS